MDSETTEVYKPRSQRVIESIVNHLDSNRGSDMTVQFVCMGSFVKHEMAVDVNVSIPKCGDSVIVKSGRFVVREVCYDYDGMKVTVYLT